MEAEEVCVD